MRTASANPWLQLICEILILISPLLLLLVLVLPTLAIVLLLILLQAVPAGHVVVDLRVEVDVILASAKLVHVHGLRLHLFLVLDDPGCGR